MSQISSSKALGAQQFRQNMTQDKELVRIAADSPTFVAYVRQRHLAPRPPRTPPAPQPTPRLAVLDRILGEIVSERCCFYLLIYFI